ncbi:hypothetical protein [Neisseria iguanae]|nr:hypothetical protein [Neisseria iguanae]
MEINADYLPNGEIKVFIVESFPGLNEETLKNRIVYKLENDFSAENIRSVVSSMGMSCQDNIGCSYHGYLISYLTVSGETTEIIRQYDIYINPNKGMPSFLMTRKNLPNSR